MWRASVGRKRVRVLREQDLKVRLQCCQPPSCLRFPSEDMKHAVLANVVPLNIKENSPLLFADLGLLPVCCLQLALCFSRINVKLVDSAKGSHPRRIRFTVHCIHLVCVEKDPPRQSARQVGFDLLMPQTQPILSFCQSSSSNTGKHRPSLTTKHTFHHRLQAPTCYQQDLWVCFCGCWLPWTASVSLVIIDVPHVGSLFQEDSRIILWEFILGS